jgi:hypothetical protein
MTTDATTGKPQVCGFPTSNPAGLFGCFHLWHFPTRPLSYGQFGEFPTAAQYDIDFALNWPEDSRHFLSDIEILHLDHPQRNWRGRRTPSWESARRLDDGPPSAPGPST